MGDLIERSVLCDDFRKTFADGERIDVREVIERIEFCTPAVYAEPVRSGTWIPCQGGSARKCSECGIGRIFWDSCLYCPNCGAHMDIE